AIGPAERHCRIAGHIVRGVGTVAGRTPRPPAAGPVAQWLEPAAHNGLVPGSSPGRPTTLRPRAMRGAAAPRPQDEACSAYQNIENNPMQSSMVVIGIDA